MSELGSVIGVFGAALMILLIIMLLFCFIREAGLYPAGISDERRGIFSFVKAIPARINTFFMDEGQPNSRELIYRYIRAAVCSVLFHWLLLYIGYLLMGNTSDISVTGFFHAVYERFRSAGDIPHYVEIAKDFYHAEGEGANNIVFFPLFPMLMRVFNIFFGNYVVSGVIIANLCLMAACIYLYKWVYEEYDRKRACEALLFFNLFPVGFFLVGAYTESLFIMLCVMCLYYIRKRKWLLVGIVGLFAALSRSQGVILIIPAVYEVIIDIKNEAKRFLASYLFVLLIPVGTIIYLLLNQVIYGKWNKFIEYQAAEPWYNTAHFISENLTQHYNMALENPYLSVIIYLPQIFLYFLFISLIIYAVIRKNVRTSTLAYGGAYIFVTYLHGWMISGPRYMLSCVTIYIILAASDSRALKIIMAVAGLIFSVLFSIWYMQGQAIM